MSNNKQIQVWDLPIRIFHWSLVCAFFIAYFTEDDWLTLHAYAGYIVIALLLFRLVWGLVGSHHARFSNFIYSPGETLTYLKTIALQHPKRYIGHNPAGSAMVLLLLISLLITSITGLVVYGSEESAGPLAEYANRLPHSVNEAIEELHEVFANFTLFLVILHIGGVIITSLQHHENLVRAMITGTKRAE